MAKRFTAAEKWKDVWFSELSSKHKLFWMFVLDDCDYCGIWEKNFKYASFCVGEELTEKEILTQFKGRIIAVNSEKWFIPKFITFQYGHLAENNKAHINIIKRLKALNLIDNQNNLRGLEGATKGLRRGLEAPKDKDKEKEKEKDKDKEYVKTGENFENLIPAELKCEEFTKAWGEWGKYKKASKKKLTESTAQAQFSKLLKWKQAGHDPPNIIRESIANGWIGLFEPKLTTGNKNSARINTDRESPKFKIISAGAS